MIRSLLWKEWREYRWFLLICAISMVIFPLGSAVFSTDGGFWIVGWVFPVILTAQVVAGEYAGGTERFFETLPVKRSVVSFIHLCFGMGVMLFPSVAGSIVFQLLFRKSYNLLDSEYYFLLRSVQSAFVIALWIIAVAGRSSSRGFVAVIGAGVLFLGWCFALLASFQKHDFPILNDIRLILTPFPTDKIGIKIELLRVLVMVVLFHVAWWNLSHVKRTSSHSKKVFTLRSFNAPRPTAIWRMLLWKTFRDVWVLALVSFVIDLGMAVLLCTLLVSFNSLNIAPSDELRELTHYSSIAGMMEWAVIGGILVIAMGMRLVLSEVSKNRDDFWRSRPINPLAYFCVKYLIGVFLALLPLCFLIGINWFTALTNDDHVIKNSLPLLVAVALVHTMLFSATVCLCVFLRNGMAAVILASSLLVFAILLAMGSITMEHNVAAIWCLFSASLALCLAILAAIKWSNFQSLRRQPVTDGVY